MAPTRNRPSLTRRRLGALLRSYREDGEKKILSKTAAKAIGVESTILGRMERGEHRIHPEQLAIMLDLYGIDDSETHAELRRACMEPFDAGWWYAYRNEIPEELLDFAALENSAVRTLSTHAMTVNGLLQCPSYMREVQGQALVEAERKAQDSLTAFRAARHQVITRVANPMRNEMVMAEAVFHENSDTMAEQIRFTLGLSFRENLDIRIMETSSPYFKQMSSQGYIMEFRKPWPDVMVTAGMNVFQFTTDKTLIQRGKEHFFGVMAQALSAEDSRAYLMERLRSIERSKAASAVAHIKTEEE